MGKRKKRKIPSKQPPQGKPTEYGADIGADSRRDNGIDLNHRQEKASMASSERNWRLSAPKNPPQEAGKKPEARTPPSASQRKNPALKKVLPKSENQRSSNGEGRHQAGAEKEPPDSASSKNEAAPKAESRLKFTDGDAGILKKGTGAAARKTAAAAEAFGHEKVHEAEQENSGVEAAHKTELAAEVGVRKAGHFANEQYRKKQAEQKASRLQESASEESSTKFRHEGSSASRETPKAEKSHQTGHFYQKQRNKKYASEAVSINAVPGAKLPIHGQTIGIHCDYQAGLEELGDFHKANRIAEVCPVITVFMEYHHIADGHRTTAVICRELQVELHKQAFQHLTCGTVALH